VHHEKYQVGGHARLLHSGSPERKFFSSLFLVVELDTRTCISNASGYFWVDLVYRGIRVTALQSCEKYYEKNNNNNK